MDYREAGVDIEEGYRAVERYRELAGGTMGALGNAVLNGIGSFAGMMSLKEIIEGMDEPVLVSGTDGVGTKLDLAFKMKKYDTVGIDCVAMCVNDILCHGARPLFFLDYLACGKLSADTAAALVRGVAAGCREAGCVLLGGETAEMPGFYDEGKYDIAGFAAGIVDRRRIVSGVREGDALIGVASSGAHSNGFSLIRRALPDLNEDFGGMPLGFALLEPTRIYVKPVLALLKEIPVHGLAHITGGGFYENIPRMFQGAEHSGPAGSPRPSGLGALIKDGSWTIPPIFDRVAAGIAGLKERGAAAQEAGRELLKAEGALRTLMFNTFNMGIGFVLALDPEYLHAAVEYLDGRGYPARQIGTVISSEDGKVRFE
ncbi:MAG: phosphoribosylformylglycinamidine cyclo-ligase [Treponema sp.]|nr:phosphoribosylformylglycinamidine cyclo-ligase [Treponema sp.]